MMKKIQTARISRHEKLDFIRRLKCLQPLDLGDKMKFKTARIYDFKKDCVIVSWSWDPSKYESKVYDNCQCFIDDRLSDVRGSVWRRTAAYMRNKRVDHVWIDKECNPQEDGQEKQQAMSVMDLLYHWGSHPLGILTRPIGKEDDLHLLAQILQREMLKWSRSTSEFSIKKGMTERAGRAIELLRKITSDKWWTRAWVYQESYHGADRMRLLIPHDLKLKKLKAKYRRLFGNLKGELIIESTQFSKALTDLCSAFKRSTTRRGQIKKVDGILSKAGRYSVLLERETSMSPRVIADVGSRDVSYPSDRISIIANCCSYNVRLKEEDLLKERFSHSLAILVSFLLNGEIFKFEPDEGLEKTVAPSDLTVIEFIQRYAFDRFSPPFQGRELTYNKNCRFSWVNIKADGVHTSGHLWKLWKREIGIQSLQLEGRMAVKKTLWGLCKYIKSLDDGEKLGSRLERFLNSSPESPKSAAGEYMWEMAQTLAHALHEGHTLKLGYLYNSEKEPKRSPPMAIFVCPDEDMERNRSGYVFTSSQPRKTSDGPGYICDVDKHVSLQVNVNNPRDLKDIWGRLPVLKARAWMHGLWFGTENPHEVVFPLPAVLSEL